MSEVTVIFEREAIEGPAVVGSTIGEVGRRFGVSGLANCDISNDLHNCKISIVGGAACLSSTSEPESELIDVNPRNASERFACFAQITGPGEIRIMTQEKEPAKTEVPNDKFVDDFTALPLEKKLASLLRMEAVTLGETFDFVISSPMKVFSKVGDVMAEFGIKLEEAAKEAGKPKTSRTATSTKSKTGSTRSKRATKKKPDSANP